MKNYLTVPSLDEKLEILANDKRRRLLLSLLEHERREETSAMTIDLEAEAESSAYLLEMRHTHLPKMVEYGFVDWDEDLHQASKGPNFEEVRPMLELLVEHEDEFPNTLI